MRRHLVSTIASIALLLCCASIGATLTSDNVTISGAAATRLVLKTTASNNNASNLRWQNSSSSNLFTMGPDTGQQLFLYDNVNSLYNLYIDNASTSYLSFGTSAGGLQYIESSDEVGLFASGLVRLRLTGNAAKLSTHPYFQRRTSGTAKPTLGSNCNGSGSASWANDDSGDVRGAVTLGTGASACTLSFTVPWDLSTNVGKPVCTANSSTSGVSIAVTASGDHDVTFTPSSSGSTTIYYHCDGIVPPP